MNESLSIAFPFPGVVDIDVNLSGVLHPAGDDGIGLAWSSTRSAKWFQRFHSMGGVSAR